MLTSTTRAHGAPKTFRLPTTALAKLHPPVKLSPREQDVRDYTHGAPTITTHFERSAAIRRCAAYQYLQG